MIGATMRAAVEDDVAGESARMAYYLFLSLFPLVLVVFALTGLVGGDDAFRRIVAIAHELVPSHAWRVVEDLLREITERERPGVLSIGVVLTMWAASSGIAGLIVALNRMYELREGRGWWRRRALALALLLAGATLAVLAATAIVLGLQVMRRWSAWPVWTVARWPVAFVLVSAAVWLAYLALPARAQRGVLRETAIGAVTATALWSATTIGFGYYVGTFGRYGKTYGAVGAVIVLLLWLQLTSACVLLGAELATVLERRARGGRLGGGDPGPPRTSAPSSEP
ncbi:MAG TPA: YihY/virulence factor BrkB family protein [Gemmatimonadaceae bacterium]|nr:YihY/virulence factor BrkB family protein [Gemmatimonadaceae bacterium]